ncbi:hypothetical protein HMPREF9554_02343 [Treponema phagedenis F0421]|nr:hypothetical protein HMPREF9554_02343 [Treponema phagedenis F0421]
MLITERYGSFTIRRIICTSLQTILWGRDFPATGNPCFIAQPAGMALLQPQKPQEYFLPLGKILNARNAVAAKQLK